MEKTARVMAAFAVVTWSAVAAGAFEKTGTTAADFLKIGVGARSVAMAGAVVADPEGLEALYWNPAGLAGSERRSFGGTHASWIAGISHDFIALSAPIHPNWTLGGYIISLAMDEMEQTTVLEPEGTNVYFDYGDLAAALGLGVRLTDRFRLGGAFKVIHTDAFNETATAVALDVGTHLVTTFHGLAIGMALSNFGTNMKMDGSDLIVPGDPESGLNNQPQEARLETDETALPLIFRVGLAMDVLGDSPALATVANHRLTAAISGDHYAENIESAHAGVEYAFRDMFFLRGGYHFTDDERSWTAGAGLAYRDEQFGFCADFAYEDMGLFDLVPRIGLAVEF